ncbi:hypothetical protein PC116_g15128 [Phytophthora cactorum]|uniref:Uncharacterized protein n=1 Tax=Phytophthora cactorum TaxID=29920 RepID=A0A8T1F5M1_9STRA|nr:hypothetical protein PC111_g20801 [Phytophthora cactorum]KAG2963027.1 hypothetical protein PC118_g21100 [Phytophthora cactorum]KAG4236806.1 hypothetical protein PC116_g15128 [Phytophthora cactorum]
MFHIAALVSSFLAAQSTAPPLSKDDRDVLWIRCQDTGDEFHELFTSVYERLRHVHRTLQGCGRGNLLPSVAVLVLHRRLVARFQAAVTKHRALNVLVRFATKRAEETCADDRVEATMDAAMQPNFELEYHTQEIPQQQVKLMRKTISKVLRCSNVHVPKISPFFIPSVDMELGEIHDKIKDTNCEIKRSVYDQETRLIAQYLSADNRYARQLFWEATEIWHGFEHPNVAKIVGESMLLSQPCVVWEDAAANGNFIHYFSSERENNQRNLWRMFLQVGHGLNHIHQRGGIHGNLKCSHILVAENGTPKICHLELIKGAEVGAVDRWKGPEYNLGKGLDPSKAGDVYAFGLCIIEARTGDIPYGLDCDDSVKSKLEELECYPRPAGMRDDDEWNVVKRFVAHDPTDRPTMAQAIEMMEELVKKKAMEEKKW